ncbi:MAG: ATP-binding cassette domain-containing protein [Bradymonadales bacterium]|nr:MAG: ATP-binding cassette domain-containing protein [Bradymonadales bacterium]
MLRLVLLCAKNLRIQKLSGPTIFETLNFEVQARDRIQILASSGRGQSLLLKALAGVSDHLRISGDLSFEGESILHTSARDRRRRGLYYHPSEPMVFSGLSNLENFQLGLSRAQWNRALSLLQASPCAIPLNQSAEQNDIRQNTWLSLLRFVALRPKLALVDRVLSKLTKDDQKRFFKILSEFSPESAWVYPCSLGEFSIFKANKFWSLPPQRLIEKDLESESQSRPLRLESIRDMSSTRFPPKNFQSIQKDLWGLSLKGDLKFRQARGEIVGIYAKRPDEIFPQFFRDDANSARWQLIWKASENLRLKDLMMKTQGISIVSGYRMRNGMWPSQTGRFNLSFSYLRNQKRSWIPSKTEERLCLHYQSLLRLSSEDLDREMRWLSDDTQQKILLGRALSVEPQVLIAEDLTRGMSEAAKEEVYFVIRDLADYGVAVLWISREAQEMESLCHRIYSFSEDFQRTLELSGEELKLENLVEAVEKLNEG